MIKLISKDKKEINVEIIHFPDGEVQPVIEQYDRKENNKVTIVTRITNAEDLFILMQVVDVLKRNGTRFDLKILYLMGARMDRVMDFNRPFTLDIIANIINSFNADYVYIAEPHSNESLRRINNSLRLTSIMSQKVNNNAVIVLPDHGAYARWVLYNSTSKEVVICSKKRDEKTGKIIKFEVENPEVAKKYQELHIIDDLCDAGGTFVAIAKILRELNPTAKLCIHVTHLVNSIGLKNLSENYDEVYITNSFKDWQNLPKNVYMKNIDI